MVVGLGVVIARVLHVARRPRTRSAAERRGHRLADRRSRRAIVGGALFLRYSLAAFLRFWLARFIYEQQAQTDRIVERLEHGSRPQSCGASGRSTGRSGSERRRRRIASSSTSGRLQNVNRTSERPAASSS